MLSEENKAAIIRTTLQNLFALFLSYYYTGNNDGTPYNLNLSCKYYLVITHINMPLISNFLTSATAVKNKMGANKKKKRPTLIWKIGKKRMVGE